MACGKPTVERLSNTNDEAMPNSDENLDEQQSAAAGRAETSCLSDIQDHGQELSENKNCFVKDNEARRGREQKRDDVPGVLQCADSAEQGAAGGLSPQGHGARDRRQRSTSPSSPTSSSDESRDDSSTTVSKQLKRWAEDETLGDGPAFFFFSTDTEGQPLTLTRREVYTLAKRYAHRLIKLVLAAEGLSKVHVINTLPASPARVITDLGIILAGAILVDGPRDHHGWVTFDTNFHQLEGCKVIVVAEGSHVDLYLENHRDALQMLRGSCVDRIVPARSTEVFDETLFKKDLLSELRSMPADQEFEVTTGSCNKVLAAWRSPVFNEETSQELIGFQRQGLEELGRQMHELLNFDPAHDLLLNPSNPDLPWGFPLAYVYYGVTTALMDKLQPRRPHSASGNMRALYDEKKCVFMDWAWLELQQNTKAFFHAEAIHELASVDKTTMDRFERSDERSTMQFTRLALCGVISERLVKPFEQMSREVVVAYSSIEMGIITSNALQDGVPFIPGDVGTLLEGVQIMLMNAHDPSKEVKTSKPHKPATFSVQNTRLGIQKRFQAGMTRWDPVPAEHWWPTHDLAFTDRREHLHVVGRVVWKLPLMSLASVPVCTVERNCVNDMEFKELVYAELVIPAKATQPVHTEVVVCVVLHLRITQKSLSWVRDRFSAMQTAQSIEPGSQAQEVVIFDRLPKIFRKPDLEYRELRRWQEVKNAQESKRPVDPRAPRQTRVVQDLKLPPNRPYIARQALKVRSKGGHRVIGTPFQPLLNAIHRPTQRLIDVVRLPNLPMH